MVKPILQIGNPLLYKSSQPVAPEDILSRENQQLIQDMFDTCNHEKESTAGLSAVQIGVLKQIYIIRRIDLDTDEEDNPVWEALINPKVEYLSEKKAIAWEGCLSIGTGDKRLFGPVSRYQDVRVEYHDKYGKPQNLEAHGFLAHIIQHEQDHLDGVLFLKYIHNPENIWKSSKLDEYIEDHDTFPPVKS